MKSPRDRLDKITALLDSPNAGEREAARAALERIKPPAKGTEAWREAVREWNRKIDWAVSRMGTPGLTAYDVRTIRNLNRYRGDPWSRGADAFIAVYSKLKSACDRPCAIEKHDTQSCAI
jgi:hypothetical protein